MARSYHARLTDGLTKRRQPDFLRSHVHGPTTASADGALAQSIEKSGRVYIPVRHRSGIAQGNALNSKSMSQFTRHAQLGSISVFYNYQNAVWRLPIAVPVEDGLLPSYAAQLAGVSPLSDKFFIPDYSIDPSSIPLYSASDILERKIPAKALRGKDSSSPVTTDASATNFFPDRRGRRLRPVIAPNPKPEARISWLVPALLRARRRRFRGPRLPMRAAGHYLAALSLLLLGPILL